MHAGHGLTFETVGPIAAFPELKELNIGHFLISDAVFNGLGSSIKKMKKLIEEAHQLIIGTGTDLANIDRIKKVLIRHGDRFRDRVFAKN